MPSEPGYDQPATTNLSSLSAAIVFETPAAGFAPATGPTSGFRLRPAFAVPTLLPMLFAFSVASVPVVVPNPTAELRRSGALSIGNFDRRRGQRISISEARLLALRVLATTEARLRSERMAEFQFFLTFDEDQSQLSG